MSTARGSGLPTYPGFCELRVLKGADPDAFAQCKEETGFAVEVVEVDEFDRQLEELIGPVEYCRLLKPAECPAGVRIDVDICRDIEGRGWSCAPDYELMNEFNRCYRPLEALTGGSHRACGEGAPVLVAQSCADYVGADFTDALDCVADYPTVDPPDADMALSSNSGAGDSGDYWCKFDRAYLEADCHGAGRPPTECAPSIALCLKRSTRTGGCDAIAHTIRCRALEVAYLAGDLAAPEVRREGCQPCVLLPFESVPSDCPGNVLAEPLRNTVSDEESRVLAARGDFNVNSPRCVPQDDGSVSDACLAGRVCADPPRGRITWSSTHFSQQAVVNSPVLVGVRDIPVEVREGNIRWWRREGMLIIDTVLPYPTSPPGDFGYAMARFGRVDPGDATLDSRSELVAIYGECMFHRQPQFRLQVRELWPDSPDDLNAIEGYFGSSALDWWHALDPATEWEARTVARGLEYWPKLSSAAARRERVAQLTEEIDCSFELPVWCRWTPSRTGYFEVKASGAWIAARWISGSREIISETTARLINDYLRDNVREFEALMQEWGATPAQLGLAEPTVSGDPYQLLPRSDLTSESIFSGSESAFSCGGTDLRVSCSGGGGTFGNYTETDPVGVIVHDVRVATRAPNH